MKTMMTTLILSVLTFQAHAETVTETVATNKQWGSYLVQDHSAWATEACVAATLVPDAALEVYAEKVDNEYTEPTVQVIFTNMPEVYSAEVYSSALSRWTFTRASHPQDPALQVVLARLKDREDLITKLKRDNGLTVKLKDAKGKLVKTLQFSLAGSSKTIDAEFKHCGLKFQDL